MLASMGKVGAKEASQVSKLTSALALKEKLMIKILNSKKNLKIL